MKQSKIIFPYLFYFQVLLALHEKQIEFTPYVIDVSNGEQFASWFLNLNPKGEVPVLQDGCFIIPDSAHIIGYLENKYSKGMVTQVQVYFVYWMNSNLLRNW